MTGRSITPFDVELRPVDLPPTAGGTRGRIMTISLYVKDGLGKSTTGASLISSILGTGDEAIDKEIDKLKHDLHMLGLRAKRLARTAIGQ